MNTTLTKKNPECTQVGEKHKHRWVERFRDKEACEPDDISAPVSDPVAVWADEDFRLVEVLSIVSRWSRPDEFADVLAEAA